MSPEIVSAIAGAAALVITGYLTLRSARTASKTSENEGKRRADAQAYEYARGVYEDLVENQQAQLDRMVHQVDQLQAGEDSRRREMQVLREQLLDLKHQLNTTQQDLLIAQQANTRLVSRVRFLEDHIRSSGGTVPALED